LKCNRAYFRLPDVSNFSAAAQGHQDAKLTSARSSDLVGITTRRKILIILTSSAIIFQSRIVFWSQPGMSISFGKIILQLLLGPRRLGLSQHHTCDGHLQPTRRLIGVVWPRTDRDACISSSLIYNIMVIIISAFCIGPGQCFARSKSNLVRNSLGFFTPFTTVTRN
jgi:hypothetical protein